MPDEEVLDVISRYVEQKLSLADFQSEFAAKYFQIRQSGDRKSRAYELCDLAVGPLAELSRGHRSESSLHEELENAVRPFRKLVR